MHLGWSEILLIVVVILVLFGSQKIPEIARSMGKARGEFERGKNEMDKELKKMVADSENNDAVDDSGTKKN